MITGILVGFYCLVTLFILFGFCDWLFILFGGVVLFLLACCLVAGCLLD